MEGIYSITQQTVLFMYRSIEWEVRGMGTVMGRQFPSIVNIISMIYEFPTSYPIQIYFHLLYSSELHKITLLARTE